MILEPIGAIRSTVTSEILIEERYAPGLAGLDSFSHVIVVFHMHRSTFHPATHLVRRPQGRTDMPITGIFAQRAKHRPNPIGVTAARLLSVEGNVVTVRGLDAIDGTPVLDLKPYFPQYDRKNAETPRWVDELMENYF